MRLLLIKIFVLFLLQTFLSCSSKRCEPKEPKELFAVELGYAPSSTYSHSVYVENISKSCDSSTIMSIAYNYIKNIAKETPVEGIDFFNSLENYDSGETLSQPKSFWSDCVVSIEFDIKTQMPKEFAFYDWRGNQIYKGITWKH